MITSIPALEQNSTTSPAAASFPPEGQDMDWDDVDLNPRAISRRKLRKPDGTNHFAPTRRRNDPEPGKRGRPRKFRGFAPLGSPIDARLGYLRINVAALMEARGLTYKGRANLTDFVRGTGLSQVVGYRMLRHPERILGLDTSTIARVCEYLQCQPGEWLRYVPLDPQGAN